MDAGFVWLTFAPFAFIATLSATELVRVCAHHLRAVDQPGGRRLHGIPTARMGGLGIFWGVAVALLAGGLLFVSLGAEPPAGASGLPALLLAGGFMLVVGFVDDVRGIPAIGKLAAQVLAALIVFAWGWRADTIGLPGIASVETGAWSLPLTVGWIVLATNAFNLIDGLDGLASGIGIVIACTACLMLSQEGGAVFALAAAMAGALLAFMWFNLHPAMIFMGDAGSLFVGFTLSALVLNVGGDALPGAFPLIPLLLFAIPVADTFDAILRRSLRSMAEPGGVRALRALPQRIFSPDGLHIHHRMRRAGLGVRRSAALLWAATASFAAAAWMMSVAPGPGLGAAASLLLVAGWARARLPGDRDLQSVHGTAVQSAGRLVVAETARLRVPRPVVSARPVFTIAGQAGSSAGRAAPGHGMVLRAPAAALPLADPARAPRVRERDPADVPRAA